MHGQSRVALVEQLACQQQFAERLAQQAGDQKECAVVAFHMQG
jgi:hypothetical protein